MIIVIFFFAHWFLSLFTQSFFYHRYAAHQMFTMSKSAEKVFFVLSAVFQGSSYLSPYVYGALHRLHHAYADTEKDPHSPLYSKNVWKLMVDTKNVYHGILKGTINVEPKFLKNLPEWKALDLLADSWIVRVSWAVFYTAFYVAFAGTQWWWYLLLPIHFIMGPFHGAIINWFAHKIGYTNFKVKDTSKNLFPFSILMLGEGLHNNHHALSARANFGVKWYELDPVYPVILLLHAIRVIKLKKTEPSPALAEA